MSTDTIILDNINITPLLDAQKALDQALGMVSNELERDGAIQRFEYCFELAWKTLKRVLKHRGLQANSPREVFRLAAQDGLIQDAEQWFTFLHHRNNTVHTYNAKLAEEIFVAIPSFNHAVVELIQTLTSL